MRSTSNPGGQEWVRREFIEGAHRADDLKGPEFLQADSDYQFGGPWVNRHSCPECGGEPDPEDDQPCVYCDGLGYTESWFFPARMTDNPYLDTKAYRKKLISLGHVERYRLEHGRWDMLEAGTIFLQEWFRYYEIKGTPTPQMQPNQTGKPIIILKTPYGDKVPESQAWVYFNTVDTASTVKSYSDYTVISTWAWHPQTFDLVLLDVIRKKVETPLILPMVLKQSAAWRTDFTIIENKSSGIGVIQEARGERGRGITVIDYNPGTVDKISRASVAQHRVEAGQVYFPQGRPHWKDSFLAELISFNPDSEHDDCVDTLTMACDYVAKRHHILSGHHKTPIEAVQPIGHPVLSRNLIGGFF